MVVTHGSHPGTALPSAWTVGNFDGNLDPAVFKYTPSGAISLNTTAIGTLVRVAATPFYAGQMDDVAVWERPLTQAEVQQVMNNSISAPTQT